MKPDVSLWLEALKESVEQWELDEFDRAGLSGDAFEGELKFGTGGIRALMGVGPNRMNRVTVRRIVQGVSAWVRQECGDAPTVAVGYDTRIHSREFAELAASILAANGVRVHLFANHVPTPVLCFAVRELSCSAGVCFTASHNPREYNGCKVYDSAGVQVTDRAAGDIQHQISRVDLFGDALPLPLADACESGLVFPVGDDFLDSYLDAVEACRLGIDCSNLNLVYSPLHGTGLEAATRLFDRLGASWTVVDEQVAPDGGFSDCPKPNPENPGAMERGMRQMTAQGADLFIATDPDADRVGVACVDGGSPRLLSGNEVGLLLFDYICQDGAEGRLEKPVAVTTIVTDPLADAVARANSVELRRTLTGFKYIGEQIGAIKAEGGDFVFGFEESDGYLRGTYVRDKDGANGAMLVCEAAAHYKRRGMTFAEALSDLHRRYGFSVGVQVAVRLSGAAGSAIMGALRENAPASLGGLAVEQVIDYLPGAPMPVVGGLSQQQLPPSNVLEWRLSGGSRVLVRPSGTEPKLKAYVYARADGAPEAEALLAGMCADVRALVGSRGSGRGGAA